MIAISGIPGTGKTTLCMELSRLGYTCLSLGDFLAKRITQPDGEVDVSDFESLEFGYDFVESHMSHVISGSDAVIILSCREETVKSRLEERGYDLSKINENLDAQRSEVIYSEAMERLPANRILVIDCSSRSIEDIASMAIGFRKVITAGR